MTFPYQEAKNTLPSFNWEAMNEESADIPKGIVLIIFGKPEKISYKEILTKVGHEYGHIVDADEFQNSTAPYDTKDGYKQEETKAMLFEEFVSDVYEMAELFIGMLETIGIAVGKD